MATVRWLTEFAVGCTLGPDAGRRVARIRQLGVDVAVASAAAGTQPRVFPTDRPSGTFAREVGTLNGAETQAEATMRAGTRNRKGKTGYRN